MVSRLQPALCAVLWLFVSLSTRMLLIVIIQLVPLSGILSPNSALPFVEYLCFAFALYASVSYRETSVGPSLLGLFPRDPVLHFVHISIICSVRRYVIS